MRFLRPLSTAVRNQLQSVHTPPPFPAASRHLSTPVSRYPADFSFFPDFFTVDEQRVLLRAALRKLDAMESGKFRRRRRDFLRNPRSRPQMDAVQAVFLPDECYDFQEGHFDGVIKRYREMHVTSWPEDMPEVLPLLERLAELHPKQNTQTHILHLASDGEILPHVDNVDASGSWILGVSLGDERTLRLESSTPAGNDTFEIPLPSGSVYLQKDAVRYGYQHSILKAPGDGVVCNDGRQRLSIMIRDRIASHHV